MFNRKLKHSETDLMRKMINDVKKINTSNSSSSAISTTIATNNTKTNNKLMKYTNKEINISDFMDMASLYDIDPTSIDAKHIIKNVVNKFSDKLDHMADKVIKSDLSHHFGASHQIDLKNQIVKHQDKDIDFNIILTLLSDLRKNYDTKQSKTMDIISNHLKKFPNEESKIKNVTLLVLFSSMICGEYVSDMASQL